MKLITPRNYAFDLNSCEPHSDEPSLTVPHMALSLKDLITRYTKNGISYPAFEGVYQDDPFYDNIENMDFAERKEFSQDLKQHVDIELTRLRTPKPKSSAPPSDPSQIVE